MNYSKIMGAFAAIAVAGYTAGAAAQMEVKIGYATINDPQQALGMEIEKRLAANPDMKMSGRNFPAGQIGSIPRMIEGLQFGTLELMITPPGFLIGLNPALQVLDAPGVFDDVDHADKTVNDPEFYSKYSKLTTDKGVTMLNLYIYGPTSIASLRPIRTLEDLKGMKIRVLATKMESALVSKFGATGVPVSYTEVLPALQQGTLDGARTAIIVMTGSQFYTVTKFITVIESGMVPSATFASNAFLKKLSAQQREFLTKMVKDLTPFVHESAKESGLKAEQIWKDNGAEVIRLSDDDQKEFIERVRPLGDEFLGSNPQTKDMFEALKASAARARG
ncbi:MAG: TRAP transporter substrate-binding protein [Rhodospirillaceae bacterium]